MDIVDRLRGKEITHSNTPYAEIAKEAATEITRLRKERDEARLSVKLWHDAYATGRNEPLAIAKDSTRSALPQSEATK